LDVREYLVLKYDGKAVRFPVLEGDAAQARLRALLCQGPDDYVVAVTEDAYIRVGWRSASSYRSDLRDGD
jgi:hypothetical protein